MSYRRQDVGMSSDSDKVKKSFTLRKYAVTTNGNEGSGTHVSWQLMCLSVSKMQEKLILAVSNFLNVYDISLIRYVIMW